MTTSRSLPRRGALPLAAAAVLQAALWAALPARGETDREYCERQQGAVRAVCLRDLEKARPAAPASPQQAAPAPRTAPAAAPAAPVAPGAAPYKVVGGDHVDPQTLEGFRTWRAAACDRCHGPNQEGLVGPSLLASLKTLSRDDFKKVVTEGRLEKGMPSFGTSNTVVSHLDQLYAYLKGRSDGAITKAHVQAIQ